MHRERKQETGGGTTAGGRPGVDHHRGGRRRGAGQRARVGDQGQPGRQRRGERVRQAPASDEGGRQGQGRNGVVDGVALRHHRGRPEIRRIVIADRHHHPDGHDRPVAAHHMDDGDGVVRGVKIIVGGDGDGLLQVPGRGGKGQGAGDHHLTIGGVARRDGHRTRGRMVQPHGIGGGLFLPQDEGGGREQHPGGGRRYTHLEAPVASAGQPAGRAGTEPDHVQHR